jgi:hypothetical protein
VALIPPPIYFDLLLSSHYRRALWTCPSHRIQRRKEMFQKPDLFLSLGERVAAHWSATCKGKFVSITEQQCVGLVSGR